MKYYRVTVYTPFCGEEADHYIKAESRGKLEEIAAELAYENGLEWCDDQVLEEQDMTEAEYFADCGYGYEEITLEEYNNNCDPWDREEDK